MAAKVLDIFRGIITYNTIALYANGTKKRFTGFIVIKDEFNNETSYKINSFRSQVTIQSETLGERGMKGMHCTVHGEFKENTWNGETKWELMAEKLILDGHEQLAADAEAAGTPLPQVPPGTLPVVGAPIATATYVAPTGPAPVVQPNKPAPIPGSMSGPLQPVAGPAPLTGGYVHTANVAVPTIVPVSAAPIVANVAPVVGGYIHVPQPVAAVVPQPVAAVVPQPVAAVVPQPVAAVVPQPVAAVVPQPVAAVVPTPQPVAAVVPTPQPVPMIMQDESPLSFEGIEDLPD